MGLGKTFTPSSSSSLVSFRTAAAERGAPSLSDRGVEEEAEGEERGKPKVAPLPTLDSSSSTLSSTPQRAICARNEAKEEKRGRGCSSKTIQGRNGERENEEKGIPASATHPPLRSTVRSILQ